MTLKENKKLNFMEIYKINMGNWCDPYPYLKVYQKRKTTRSKILD